MKLFNLGKNISFCVDELNRKKMDIWTKQHKILNFSKFKYSKALSQQNSMENVKHLIMAKLILVLVDLSFFCKYNFT